MTATATPTDLLDSPELQLNLVGKPIHLSITDSEDGEELSVAAILLGIAVVEEGLAFRFQGLEDEPLHFTKLELETDEFVITYEDAA